MNVEENRLRSFDTWPASAPIDGVRLARAGFYATGNYLEVECHWCHKRISDLKFGDQIMARHRRLFPLCTFIVNPNECGNVPLFGSQPSADPIANGNPTDSQDYLDNVDLKNEQNRLATFKNWPNPNISPQALSKAGFYYLNHADRVKCAWCKGVIAEWEKDDNAFEEHQRFFPNCPRVQLGPLIEITSDGIRDLGIQQMSQPKKPKYSSLDARLRTYAQWPISDIQKPDALAQAGFFYQGTDDQVRCFQCNGGLRSWQKEDDPWFDHAKWFPNCHFVKLVKGIQYVTVVQNVSRRLLPNNVCEAKTSVKALEDAMLLPPVIEALEMGFNAACIRNVTQRHLESYGRPYDCVEELAHALLFEQTEEDDEIESDSFTYSDIHSNVPSETQLLEYRNAPSSSNAISNVPVSIPPTSTSSSIPDVTTIESAVPPRIDRASSVPGTSKGNVAPELKRNVSESNANDSALSLEEENRKLKDARLCKVCMDEEVGVVFLPCGHLVTCVQCSPGVTQCPLCRTSIKGFVRTFLS